MDAAIPKPVLFNYWKHHQGFLINFVSNTSSDGDPSYLRSQLKKVGSSTTDLYTGDLAVDEIAGITQSLIAERKIDRESRYLQWIRQSEEEYQMLPFPDHSIWIFKIGTEEGRFVHIHPGRNVPHTIRVKANVLKTAIACCFVSLHENKNPLDIETINYARNTLIGLDPVRFITFNQELARIIHHFSLKLKLLKA